MTITIYEKNHERKRFFYFLFETSTFKFLLFDRWLKSNKHFKFTAANGNEVGGLSYENALSHCAQYILFLFYFFKTLILLGSIDCMCTRRRKAESLA